jgi:hypothetical protein
MDLEERKVRALETISSRLWWIALWLFGIFLALDKVFDKL